MMRIVGLLSNFDFDRIHFFFFDSVDIAGVAAASMQVHAPPPTPRPVTGRRHGHEGWKFKTTTIMTWWLES
jgi:hypothetical protein